MLTASPSFSHPLPLFLSQISIHPQGTSLGSHDVRISVKVEGLGPAFVMKIKLHNTGQQAVLHTQMLFSYPESLYSMGTSGASNASGGFGGGSVPGFGGSGSGGGAGASAGRSAPPLLIPILLPGVPQTFEAGITSVDPQGRAGQVLILLQSSTSPSSLPYLSASVRFPVSEIF